MKRPFISHSFTQLEAEYDRARKFDDRDALSSLVNELSFRTKNKNTPSLLSRCRKALAARERAPKKISSPQGVLPLSPAGQKNGRAKPVPTRAKTSSMKPTPEQHDAVSAFMAGKDLKINAYAGTGKTSTLQLLARSTQSKGLYIAFNKDIVVDAREKFPATVSCSTTHSLAARATPSTYRETPDKMFGQINTHQLVELMGIQRQVYAENRPLTAIQQAHLILQTVRRFAQSGDGSIAGQHVPQSGAMLALPDATVAEIKASALDRASLLWSQMTDPHHPVPLGHDGYLKLWALTEPQLPGDFILLDEAQDTNPVVLDLLRKQNSQMVYVGDKYQQIYEWRGAVNAMELIETDHTTYLTTSFRFGGEIANYASKVLRLLGETRPISGNPKIASSIGSVPTPSAILGRTNASTISAIIESVEGGRKPYLVGGTREMKELLGDVRTLKAGQPVASHMFFGFSTWQEVVGFSKTEEGAHLATFVNLIEKRGEKQLFWALGKTVEAEKADIVISTAHKSKGREWKSVRLMDDFLAAGPKRSDEAGFDPAELRLFYVAVTRAKDRIEIPDNLLTSISEGRRIEMPSQKPSSPKVPPASPARPGVPATTVSPAPATAQVPEKRRGFVKWLFG